MYSSDIKFDFDDITLVPAKTSEISSRYKDIDLTSIRNGVFNKYHKEYRLMTAPMDTVIDIDNAKEFYKNSIVSVLPRHNVGEVLYLPNGFTSIGINELREDLNKGGDRFHGTNSERNTEPPLRVCIDIANGHMKDLIDVIGQFKEVFPHSLLMVGNIANPETFKVLSDAGADYCRVGIGAGSGCLTSEQTSVYYPMASLIKECRDVADSLTDPAMIVADGGMRKYADIIKALNLGADYVMIGGLFNKMVESSGDNYLWKKIPVSGKFAKKYYDRLPIYKKFRGMSTKQVQREWGKKKVRTSEGISKMNKVKYSLPKWINNYEHYLRSAMSYTGCKTIIDFIGQQSYIQITSNAYRRFNK